MTTTRAERRGLALGLVLMVGPWLLVEGWGPSSAVRVGVRFGLAAGVGCFPFLLWIYRGAFRGPLRGTLRAIVLTIVFKAVVLGGIGWLVWRWFTIPVLAVIGPLFYALFTLGFLAISLSWLRRTPDSPGT